MQVSNFSLLRSIQLKNGLTRQLKILFVSNNSVGVSWHFATILPYTIGVVVRGPSGGARCGGLRLS